MKCPYCGSDNTAQMPGRKKANQWVIVRRRVCHACSKEFPTRETVDPYQLAIEKGQHSIRIPLTDLQ